MDGARLVLAAVLALLIGCAAPQQTREPVSEKKLVDGVYEASYAQLPNIAKVKVTIKDGRISDIQILSHITWHGKKAEGPIPQRIIEKQSTDVDAVTGATNSSQTIAKAVQKAIDKAYRREEGTHDDE